MRTRAVASTVLAAVLLAMAGAAPVAGASQAAGTAGTGRVSANVPLGDDRAPVRGHDVPGLVADPANPDHVVEIDEEFLRGQCTYKVTFDGGRTWTGGDLTVPADFASPPCNTFDSGGYAHFDQSVVWGSGQNVYTTFASHRGPQERPESKIVQGEGDSVLVLHSADGGKTWATGVVAIQGSPDSQPYYIRPQLAVEPRPEGDRVYVSAWGVVVTSGGAGGGGGDRRLVTTRSDDGGRTFTPSVDAQNPGEKVREPAQPAVGPGGVVYVAWRNRDPEPPPNYIAVGRSTDQGATWTRSQAGTVSAGDISGGGGFPHLAVDPTSGALYLVYQGIQNGDLDITFQRSTDGGTTWSPPIRVNDDRTGTGAQHVTPHISLAPNGRIDVVWFDQRTNYLSPATPDASGVGDVWYASSSDGGQSFSPNRRVTDHSINLDLGLDNRVGSYIWYGPVSTPLGNDRVMFAWPEPRNGNVDTDTQDVYTATLDLNAIGPAPATALPKTGPEDLSVNLSTLAYPGGAQKVNGSRATKVVVVGSNDVPSALAAAVLARANWGPLLLVKASDLTKAQKKEVARLGPGGAYMVGPASEISDTVSSSLAKAMDQGPSGPTAVVSPPERINGSDDADTARRIALMLDPRDAATKAKGTPAFDAAVVVNPASPDAATGSALAAALRMPVLFTQRDALPSATTEALAALSVRTTLVVGGVGSVGDAVLGKLPGARRLGGTDPTLTSEAVAAEAVARDVPPDVVYVVDGERPAEMAATGAAVAQVGGIMLAEPSAGVAAARRSLGRLALTPRVDRLVVARADLGGTSTGLRLALAILIFVIGIATLVLALAHRDDERRAPSGPREGVPPADGAAVPRVP
ncbi:MAG: sialidase family protein [Acidimicrobiales bacterium]